MYDALWQCPRHSNGIEPARPRKKGAAAQPFSDPQSAPASDTSRSSRASHNLSIPTLGVPPITCKES